MVSSSKCALCSDRAIKQRGGSLASDNVVNFVTCDTFEQMNTMASNKFGGSKKRASKSRSSTKQIKGGSSCDSGTSSASVFDSYTIGPATVPSGLPAQNADSLGGTNIQASVLTALAQEAPHMVQYNNLAYYPTYLMPSGIMVSSQSGGSAGCMCDGSA